MQNHILLSINTNLKLDDATTFFLIKDIADAFSSILVYNQPDKKMSLCFLNGAYVIINIKVLLAPSLIIRPFTKKNCP